VKRRLVATMLGGGSCEPAGSADSVSYDAEGAEAEGQGAAGCENGGAEMCGAQYVRQSLPEIVEVIQDLYKNFHIASVAGRRYSLQTEGTRKLPSSRTAGSVI